jgi:hypothetical protein
VKNTIDPIDDPLGALKQLQAQMQTLLKKTRAPKKSIQPMAKKKKKGVRC